MNEISIGGTFGGKLVPLLLAGSGVHSIPCRLCVCSFSFVMKAVKESLYPFDLYTPESSFSFPFHSSDCAIGFRFPSMQTCLREVFWDAVYLRERRLSWMLIGESIIPFCLKMSWDWRYRSKWFQCWYVLFRLGYGSTLISKNTHTHSHTHCDSVKRAEFCGTSWVLFGITTMHVFVRCWAGSRSQPHLPV